jgi:mRNA-degrading endonuclease RelE of RelBE toxin-antitoxin system
MSYNIVVSNEFLKRLKPLAKKYPSIKKDLSVLQEELNENPTLGDLIGTNLYKVRMKISSKNKGKSGGARVITYVLVDAETIHLVTIYDKSDLENISQNYIDDILKEEGLL